MRSALAIRTDDPKPPILPNQYQEALRAVESLMRVSDGKLWAKRADALAAWARLYHHDDLGKLARRLKLHAYRRMNELTEELGAEGSAMLRAQGFDAGAIRQIRAVGRASPKAFAEAIVSDKPPTPSNFLADERTPDGALKSLRALQHFSSRVTVREAASALAPGVQSYVASTLPDLIVWLEGLNKALLQQLRN